MIGTLTLDGSSLTSPVVELNNGELVLNNGVVITNNESSGVIVGSGSSPASIFTMNGGSIINNTSGGTGSGGGVYVRQASIFLMNSGIISGNSASIGGGVFTSGDFTMKGGTISANTATTGGGGGVLISSPGSFSIESPATKSSVHDNTASLDPTSEQVLAPPSPPDRFLVNGVPQESY